MIQRINISVIISANGARKNMKNFEHSFENEGTFGSKFLLIFAFPENEQS